MEVKTIDLDDVPSLLAETTKDVHVCGLDSEFDLANPTGRFLYYDLAQLENEDKMNFRYGTFCWGVLDYGVSGDKGILVLSGGVNLQEGKVLVIIDVEVHNKGEHHV